MKIVTCGCAVHNEHAALAKNHQCGVHPIGYIFVGNLPRLLRASQRKITGRSRFQNGASTFRRACRKENCKAYVFLVQRRGERLARRLASGVLGMDAPKHDGLTSRNPLAKSGRVPGQAVRRKITP